MKKDSLPFTYPIPSLFSVKIPKFQSVFYILGIVAGVFLLTLIFLNKKSSFINIYGFVFLLIVCFEMIMCTYLTYIQFSKNVYFEINDKYLSKNSLFKKISIEWDKIEKVDTYYILHLGTQLRIKGLLIINGKLQKQGIFSIDIGTTYSFINEEIIIRTINKMKDLKRTNY